MYGPSTDLPVDTLPCLHAWKRAFLQGRAPDPASLSGHHRGQLLGPAWSRALQRALLRALGLPRWWGKRIDGDGSGCNLVNDGRKQVTPFRLHHRRSIVDGRPCLLLEYVAGPPLGWVVDELRLLGDGVLVGLSRIDLPLLRRLSLPFLLHPKH